MKLVIAGATGGVGQLLCKQAVEAGHDVTALVRNPNANLPGTRLCQIDLAKPPESPEDETLTTAITGADAVLSALGPRNATDIGVVTTGTKRLLTAMHTASVSRIVIISAAPIGGMHGHPDPGDGPLTRFVLAPIIRRIFRANYADLAQAEALLRSSKTDWTAIRPPRLTNAPPTGHYRTTIDHNVRGGLTISRADLAALLLQATSNPNWTNHTIGAAH